MTVNWPSHVTIVQPTQFSKVANEIASLFALASTHLIRDPGARPMKNDWVSALLVTFQLVMLVLLLTAQIDDTRVGAQPRTH